MRLTWLTQVISTRAGRMYRRCRWRARSRTVGGAAAPGDRWPETRIAGPAPGGMFLRCLEVIKSFLTLYIDRAETSDSPPGE